MKILIFGPQGSGKGTQAELLARRHDLPYISTGDILRYNVKNQTDLGRQVADILKNGNLAPNDLTNKIVQDRINQPDCSVGFVLDGYPRNKEQADFLSSINTIDFALIIELSDKVAIERLSNRLACKCGLSYHIKYNPPKTPGQCDKCQGELFRRDDNQLESIKKRLSIYHTETEPILEEYEKQGILHRVDGLKTIEEVYQQIEKIINPVV